MPREVVGGLIDGELTVHCAPCAAGGDYDTLCGLDLNDDAVGHAPAEVSPRSRITCSDCLSICRQAWKYKPADFA